MGDNCCLIYKEKIVHTFKLNFRLCSKSKEVEEVNVFCCRSEGMLQHDGKEDLKQGWCKNTALLQTTLDVKSI